MAQMKGEKGGKVRTRKEIVEQIRLLDLQRKGIPRFSSFGDDNHKSIDRAIAALNAALRGRDEAASMREREFDAEDYDESTVAALDWALCDSDEAPVEDGENNVWVKKAKESPNAR